MRKTIFVEMEKKVDEASAVAKSLGAILTEMEWNATNNHIPNLCEVIVDELNELSDMISDLKDWVPVEEETK